MNRLFFVSFVKTICIFFLIACCCISCRKTTVREEVQIFILNSTDDTIHVTLYPQKTASTTPYSYPVCDDGGCGYQQTKFYLPSNNRKYLFISKDLSVEPYTLAVKAFDSICMSSTDKLIEFSHENVIGYSENIFSENSTWDFSIVEDKMPTQFHTRRMISHQYSFLIIKDKIIIEQNKEDKK